jgi:putative transposase
MDLIHNSTFRLLRELEPSTAYDAGIYRVIVDEPHLGKTITALIQPEVVGRRGTGGRPPVPNPKSKRKKPASPLVGQLIWMERDELLRLHGERLLVPIQVEREATSLLLSLCSRSQKEYEKRLLAMAGFLDYPGLRDGILVHEGLGGLVAAAMEKAQVGRTYVYRQWSALCRFGIHEESLKPRRDRCGAPGKERRCTADGYRKAGRKTLSQRVARAYGREIEPIQPGMSIEWAAAIRAADKQIPTPKPPWKKRCIQIIESGFVARGKVVDGAIVLVKPDLGKYPSDSQIKRVLTVRKTQLERLLERTTKAHFRAALRGLVHCVIELAPAECGATDRRTST